MSAVLQEARNQVRDHLVGRLIDADLKVDPFQYVYITRAFPQQYYEEMLKNLPPDEVYTDRQFDNRMMASTHTLDSFWKDLTEWMLHRDVVNVLLDMFNVPVGRLQADVRLVRDSKGYRIKPHTDIKSKVLSLLFYLAKDEEHPEEGTTVMVPKAEGFTSEGTARYPFEDFTNIWTAPYLPNTMLGFPRSNVSFHGVSGTEIPVRDVLLLNIYRSK
jgi:hypothetical protein